MLIRIIFMILFYSMTCFSFEFSPLGFDKRIDTGEGYGEFIYTNSSNEIIRYKINVYSTGKKNDISKFVTVYPKILTIKPLSSAKLKIFVESPPILNKGIYNFMIGSENISIPFLQENRNNNISPAVSFKTSVGLEMQAYVGGIKDDFKIKNEKIIKKEKKEYYIATIKNETGRGYEIGVGFSDSLDSLINVESKGRLNNFKEMSFEIEIPKFAKQLVFYDYNNQIFVGQKIDLNKVRKQSI